MATYTSITYFPSEIKSMADLLGNNQTLKTYGSKTIKFTDDNTMHLQNATQTKMYKRSMFNLSGKLSGIENYFSSCYSPNIFDVGITLNCEGLYMGENGDFQKTELLEPIQSWFTSAIISRIFYPSDLLITSKTISEDEDGETTLVNTDSTSDTYKKTFFNKSEQFKVYFPNASTAGKTDESVDQEEDIVDVINQNKLYSISLSCNDKIYTLNATALT